MLLQAERESTVITCRRETDLAVTLSPESGPLYIDVFLAFREKYDI